MLKMIRADIYRLIHGKTLWVTTGLLTLFYILEGSGKFATKLNANIGTNHYEQVSKILSGAQAPFSAMASPEFLIYFFLPLLIVIACTDFSSDAIKNTLAKGVSRVQFYFSKLMLAYVIGIVFALLQVALPLISGTVTLGFGQPLTAGYFVTLAEVFLLQLPLYLGVISVGIFLIFLTRRTAIVNVIYLVLFMVGQLIITILTLFSNKFIELLRYELVYCLKQAISLPNLAAQDIVRIVLVGFGYMIIMSSLGIYVFQKSDIK